MSSTVFAFSGADTVITSANVTLAGGTVNNNAGGSVTIAGGTITNTANDADANANAIRNNSTGAVNITGGTVEATGAGFAICSLRSLSISVKK